MLSIDDQNRAWLSKVKTLNDVLWTDRARNPTIQRWLKNFDGSIAGTGTEQHHALHLLQQFMFFGEKEIHELLRVVYRDLFRYPIIQEIRQQLGGTKDSTLVEQRFQSVLTNTRFLGLGGPGESGPHFIYPFAQIAGLNQDVLTNTKSLFEWNGPVAVGLTCPALEHLVVIDDVSGSGTQGLGRLTPLAKDLKRLRKSCRLHYFPLFATSQALSLLRSVPGVDVVRAAMELDQTYACYHPESIHFRNTPNTIDRSKSAQIMQHYGGRLVGTQNGLGFGGCQLLLAFQHNTPDNTLPVFWHGEDPSTWTPIFKRTIKKANNQSLL